MLACVEDVKLYARLLLVLLLTGVASLRAHVQSALQARAMLGDATWSRVLEIKNTDRYSPYGRRVHATVFEFNGLLWFYTDANGTQSLSLCLGRLEQEKADLGPLLHAICPGFVSFTDITGRESWTGRPERDGSFPKLRNGCFVESLAALRRFLRQGEPLTEARLLLLYVRTASGGIAGHTGLVFSTPAGRFFWDPEAPTQTNRVSSHEQAPDRMAARIYGLQPTKIADARFIPVRSALVVATHEPAATVQATGRGTH